MKQSSRGEVSSVVVFFKMSGGSEIYVLISVSIDYWTIFSFGCILTLIIQIVTFPGMCGSGPSIFNCFKFE